MLSPPSPMQRICAQCEVPLPETAEFCVGCGMQQPAIHPASTGTVPGVGAGPEGTWGIEAEHTTLLPARDTERDSPIRSGWTVVPGGVATAPAEPVRSGETVRVGESGPEPVRFKQSSDSLTIELRCPSCNQLLGIDPERLAISVACPRCSSALRPADVVRHDDRVKLGVPKNEAAPPRMDSPVPPTGGPALQPGTLPLSQHPTASDSEAPTRRKRWIAALKGFDAATHRKVYLLPVLLLLAADAVYLFSDTRTGLTTLALLFVVSVLLHIAVGVSRLVEGNAFRFHTAVENGFAAMQSGWDAAREVLLEGSRYERGSAAAKASLFLFIAITTVRAIAEAFGLPSPPAAVMWVGRLSIAAAAICGADAVRQRFFRGTHREPAERGSQVGPLAHLDGRVLDLRDSMVASEVIDCLGDEHLREILRALSGWNPRHGRDAHEHRFRDSIHRKLSRELDGGPSRVDSEYPLPARVGHSRVVDLAIDRTVLVEIKKRLRTVREVESALTQVFDYARCWEAGPVILAVGDAGHSFHADLSRALPVHLQRLRHEVPTHRWPVFAVAIGYKAQ